MTPTGATAVILVLSVLHCRGQRSSSWVQNTTTALKLGLLTTFVLAGVTLGKGDWQHLTGGRAVSAQSLPVVVSSFVYVFYGYSGWNACVYIAGEVDNTTKTLPRSILSGCVIVTLLYLAINLTYLYAIAPAGLRGADPQQVEAVAETAARALFGPAISEPLSVLIGLTIVASVSAYLLAGSRICYAMAVDGLFPHYAATVSSTRESPVAAVRTIGVTAVVLLWGSHITAGAADAFAHLLNFTTVGLVLLSGLAVSSVFVLRRRPVGANVYMMPLYPLPPVLFLLLTGLLIGFAVWQSPGPILLGVIAVFSGAPMYCLLQRSKQR